MAPVVARFGRDRRIRKSSEFENVLKTGSRGSTDHVTVTIATARFPGRLGVSAPAKSGNAVKRNKARRRVRDYYRHAFAHASPYDVVVNIRAGFSDLSPEKAKETLDVAVSKALSHRKRSGDRIHHRH